MKRVPIDSGSKRAARDVDNDGDEEGAEVRLFFILLLLSRSG